MVLLLIGCTRTQEYTNAGLGTDAFFASTKDGQLFCFCFLVFVFGFFCILRCLKSGFLFRPSSYVYLFLFAILCTGIDHFLFLYSLSLFFLLGGIASLYFYFLGSFVYSL